MTRLWASVGSSWTSSTRAPEVPIGCCMQLTLATHPDVAKPDGSKGATVFHDPNAEDRLWVIFDWDLEGWQQFAEGRDARRALDDSSSSALALRL
jgi:hypothetical protein